MKCENQYCNKKAKKGFRHCSKKCSPLGDLDDSNHPKISFSEHTAPTKFNYFLDNPKPTREDEKCLISIPPLKIESKAKPPEVSKDLVNGGNYVPLIY